MPIIERKKGKKVMEIKRFNPSARKNEIIEIEQVQIGTIRYIDGDFECLVGIETEDWGEHLSFRDKKVTFKKPRRIARIKWDVSGKYKVGTRVDLCPRDVAILDAVLKYLKKMGYYIP